jgi:high-affinity iron transporter
MLSNFIIGLREGLEAALIVGILIAYVVKTGRDALKRPIWMGVVLALVASLALGGVLTYTSLQLSDEGAEVFEGITSFLAVGFVTWMVFWMKRASINMRRELQDKVADAMKGGVLALSAAAFFAVIREGLETALFVYANFQAGGSGVSQVTGLVLGLGLAVALGVLIYKSAIKIDLRKFFTITGAALVVIAAGVLGYGIHEFQEAGILPGEESIAFDITGVMAKDSAIARILAGLVGFSPETSWMRLIVWAGYITIVMGLYFRRTGVSIPKVKTA